VSLPIAFALSLSLLAGASSPPAEGKDAPEAHRGHDYPGAQHFFNLRRATVVYPAGPGRNAERNRLSAAARAAYLEGQTGMTARVVADIEVRDEHLADNLLVLGWDNALFGPKSAPRPFERSADGFRFLGLDHLDPSADLLFFSRSPFDPDHFLLFWSRIDPERDRFFPLPRIGSDWAVFEDFLPVRQGMCLPGTAWPPERDTSAEADHGPRLLRARGNERHRATEHYDVYWDPSGVPAEDIDRIAAARERAFAAAVSALGAPPEGFRIALHVYVDAAKKRELTGVPDPTHAAPWAHELHMIRAAALSPSPHEDAHVLARPLLGPGYVTALHEGLAIAVEDRVRGLPLEVAGGLLFESGGLPTLEVLLDEESYRRLPESVGPTAAGLLGAWIRATTPERRRAATFGVTRGTPEALAAAMGRDAARIGAEFLGWVAERAAARAADVRFHKAELRAQERYVAGDWSGMIQALREALEHRRDDPQTLFNLASAQMRADAFAEAETNLRRILALDLDAAESRFRIFSHYQLGRVLDLQGRREEALSEYRTVLALPDVSDAHRLAEERIASPATREQLE
jgi:hypothetical protein